MKKVVLVVLIVFGLILACSKTSTNPVSSDEIWWESPDPDARWFTLSDYCSYKVPAEQTCADSICNERGFIRSTGYEEEACYVSGERRMVLSKVACSVD